MMRKTVLSLVVATLGAAALSLTSQTPSAPSKPQPKPQTAQPAAPVSAIVATKDFQTVVEALRQGRVDQAEPILLKLYKTSPDNPDVLLAMGTLYSLKGDAANAVLYMEKSVKAKPTAQAYAGLAAAYGGAGRGEDSVGALRKSLALDPTNISANFNLAAIYMQVNNFSEAIPLLERVVKAKPTEPEPFYLLGLCHSAMGQPAQAKTVLLKMPAQGRDMEQVLLLSGSVAAALGENAEAHKYLERAVQLYPISVGALANLGALLVKEGKSSQGIELLDKAWKTDKGSYLAGYTLAGAYYQAGKLQEARSVLGTLLTKGETPDIYLLLGQVEDELSNHTIAIGYFQRAIEIDPGETTQFALGYSQLRFGKPEEAEATFVAAMQKMPLSTPFRLGLGASYLLENKSAQALETLGPMSNDDLKQNPLGARLFALAKQAVAGSRDEAKIKAVILEMKPKT